MVFFVASEAECVLHATFSMLHVVEAFKLWTWTRLSLIPSHFLVFLLVFLLVFSFWSPDTQVRHKKTTTQPPSEAI